MNRDEEQQAVPGTDSAWISRDGFRVTASLDAETMAVTEIRYTEEEDAEDP